MAPADSVAFFDARFRRQLAERGSALNPAKRLGLPHAREPEYGLASLGIEGAYAPIHGDCDTLVAERA